eukprot:3887163-Rhodomonas_salina.1
MKADAFEAFANARSREATRRGTRPRGCAWCSTAWRRQPPIVQRARRRRAPAARRACVAGRREPRRAGRLAPSGRGTSGSRGQ